MSPHLVLLKVSSEEVIVEMVLSFSAVYAAVATVIRFRVLEALFLEITKEIVGNIVRFWIVAITGLITC
jgi:hypothetical protein